MVPTELIDFISFLNEEEQEEQLFNVWMHSMSGETFEDWKKKSIKKGTREI